MNESTQPIADDPNMLNNKSILFAKYFNCILTIIVY